VEGHFCDIGNFRVFFCKKTVAGPELTVRLGWGTDLDRLLRIRRPASSAREWATAGAAVDQRHGLGPLVHGGPGQGGYAPI
jgi:hypothetical protein